jgi:hypothetical protein
VSKKIIIQNPFNIIYLLCLLVATSCRPYLFPRHIS